MKILIVGLGSMGKRRLRLAQAAYPSHEYAGVEAKTDRRESLGIPVYGTLEEAFNRFEPDAAFICTPPLTHAGMIRTCLEHNLHVFTEINLVQDAYPENLALARKQNRVLFLSSTYLYREEIRQISKKMEAGGGWYISLYLPCRAISSRLAPVGTLSGYVPVRAADKRMQGNSDNQSAVAGHGVRTCAQLRLCA